MEWKDNRPFFEQKLFWLGVAMVVLLLGIIQKNKVKIVVSGIGNGNGSGKSLPF